MSGYRTSDCLKKGNIRLKTHKGGYFLADAAIAAQVETPGFDDAGLQQRKVLPRLTLSRHAILTFLPRIADGLLFGSFRRLGRLFRRDFNSGGIEEGRLAICRQTLLAFASEHLSLEPCYCAAFFLTSAVSSAI